MHVINLNIRLSLPFSFQYCITVFNTDYTIQSTQSFSESSGDGDSIMFQVNVISDSIIECDEDIVIDLVDPEKDNVVLSNTQVTTTIMDQNGNDGHRCTTSYVIHYTLS